MLSRLRLWPVIDPGQGFTHKRGAISLRKTVGNADHYAIERLLAFELGVDWEAYDREVANK